MYETVCGEGGVVWECGLFSSEVYYVNFFLGKGGNYIFFGQGGIADPTFDLREVPIGTDN